HAPRQEMPTRQLRSIVTADRQGLPALGHDRIQHSCHPSARETGVYFQGQTFPGVRVHHTQHPDRPPAIHRIVHEVQRPLLVRRRPGPPLAEGILLLHLLDSRLQGYELHPFFRITDCSASLSRLRSATSFRSRVFSSRNCFASCAWLTSIPPYFAFHA